MRLNRPIFLSTVGSLLVAIAIAAHAISADPRASSEPSSENEPQATGRVILYGVESTPYFVLSEMPDGIERFTLVANNVEALRELVLMAADRQWSVNVNYIRQDGERETTAAYNVWVDEFSRSERLLRE